MQNEIALFLHKEGRPAFIAETSCTAASAGPGVAATVTRKSSGAAGFVHPRRAPASSARGIKFAVFPADSRV
jgi:hypothetical protein